MKKWSFYDFSELLNLFLAPSDITVGNIRLFFHLHHGDSWVDLWWQGYVDLILVTVHTVK